jgi:sulfate permease, SulP family
LRIGRSEGLTLIVTFIATLSIRLEVAILIGVLVSLLVYLNRTTHPHVTRVLPDPAAPGRHFNAVAHGAPLCPQLDVLRIDGSLFFGAVEHVRDELEATRKERPDLRHVLLVGSAINFVDAAGADLLAEEARSLRAEGVTLYLCKLKPQVHHVLIRGGQIDTIGRDNVFETKDQAIRSIYARLDAAKCAVCTARVFNECQRVLPDGTPREPERPEFALVPGSASESR